MLNLEKINSLEYAENHEKNLEKLNKALRYISKNIESNNIPTDRECRISMKTFAGIYDLEKDEKEINRLELIYAKQAGLPLEKWKENKSKANGEQLEMLKTIIFHKNLGSDFIVVRSSRFDDIKNGIDNVIINKKTGDVICAFDEVCPRKGDRYTQKQETILKRNTKGGVSLKYGIKFDGNSEKPSFRGLNGLPIFFLALHPSEIQKGIDELNNEHIEKGLFKVFLAEIDMQIKKMEESFPEIHPQLKNQWVNFHEFIKVHLNKP